jgi:hemerythrin-like domain-containing protein
MTTVVEEARAELRREHQLVCAPLLDQTVRVAQQIQDGVEWPVAYIREGLDLWHRFVVELREPAAKEVFLPLLLAANLPTNDPRVQAIWAERPREREQLAQLEELMEGYEEHRGQAPWKLGMALRGYAMSNKAWLAEEEQVVAALLPREVDETLARQVREALGRVRSTTDRLAETVRSSTTRPPPGAAPPGSPPAPPAAPR